jgi:acetolactate synthase I/II/III large subunit
MKHAVPDTGSGYDLLLGMLRQEGISLCSGVTGGGVIHFLKYLEPHPGELQSPASGQADSPRFFSLGEYSAGFAPLGSFLATGEVGACIATTGAATKLLACGMSDAKLHDIPAIYLVPISPPSNDTLCPLQDTSAHGSNALAQLRAELPHGVFVLDTPATVAAQLNQARHQLALSKPVVLVLVHDALCQPAQAYLQPEPTPASPCTLAHFVESFAQAIKGRRVTLLAGEELARCPRAPELTTALCAQLGAAAVWSINGSNGIDRANAHGYGYVGFGGNDVANTHWQDLDEEDVLLVLGACPDEYTVNLSAYAAGRIFVLTALTDGYGQISGSFQHRASTHYHQQVIALEQALAALVDHFERHAPETLRMASAPASLNHGSRDKPRPGHVDIVQLFNALDERWPAGTVGFDDVCLSYKDRQYVTQRPNPNARFFSLYRGSAMGNALGLAIGAKIAAPGRLVVAFTGDGCFRLFAGNLAEASKLGIILFVLDNGCYGIVEQGLPVIAPELASSRYHTQLPPMDFCAMAHACGWWSLDLAPDLSNLDELFSPGAQAAGRSTLVRIPVDAGQVAGMNPRARNL